MSDKRWLLAEDNTQSTPTAGYVAIYAKTDGTVYAKNPAGTETALGGSTGMTSFIVAGDSGSSQTITDGNTLTLVGGTGIDSVASATDTITFNIDSTVVTLTGSQTLTNKTLTAPKINIVADTNGNEVIIISTTASAVNEITVANAATANNPIISATGGDTNIGITINPKGTGGIGIGASANAKTIFDVSTTTLASRPAPSMTATQRDAISSPATGSFVFSTTTNTVYIYNGSVWGSVSIVDGTETLTNKTITSPKINQIFDSNGNEEIIFTTTASAVNEITIANASTTNAPTLSTTGGDTNIGLNINPKGTGTVIIDGAVTINESGADRDTRIEGDTNANLFFVDASADAIGIGTNTPSNKTIFDVSSTTRAARPVPSMTTTERDAITSPATGSVIYNTTTNTLQFYNGTVWGNIAGASASVSHARLSATKTSGTNGDTLTATTWTTYPITTEDVDADSIVSISSNQFTLGAGTYEIIAVMGLRTPSSLAMVTRFRIQNITDGTTEFQGSQITQNSALASAVGGGALVINGIIAPSGSKAFAIQYYTSQAGTTGSALTTGAVEVYATIVIKKLS